MARDFTYIDYIVDGVVGVRDRPPTGGDHRLLNIGDCNPVGLMDMIAMIERALGRPAIKLMRPMQPGDVTATYADISAIHALTGYSPKVPLARGIERFVDRSEEHTSELQSLMRISYAVFCLKKKNYNKQ